MEIKVPPLGSFLTPWTGQRVIRSVIPHGKEWRDCGAGLKTEASMYRNAREKVSWVWVELFTPFAAEFPPWYPRCSDLGAQAPIPSD